MKLFSWNVNGLRSIAQKGFGSFLQEYRPDIICLQEIKVLPEQLSDELKNPEGYRVIFAPAERKGYSGVATYIRKGVPLEPKAATIGLGSKDYDAEGRCLITEHEDFVLYNVYVPSGTTGDLRQDFKYAFLDFFKSHLEKLPPEHRSKLIICGDFNICHRDIDIHHPRTAEKRRLSGFLPEERQWLDELTALGFIDSFRRMHGDDRQEFSWWSFRANSRAKNLGWRIDYVFVGSALAPRLQQAGIHCSVNGSDHCPVSIEFRAD